MFNNKTDERQKSEYSKIGNFSFWILYVSLAISILVQLTMNAQFQAILGELICFLVGSVVIIAGYIMKGMSCLEKPSVLVSLACGFIGFVLDFIVVIIRTYTAKGNLSDLFPSALIRPGLVFVLVFILIWFIGVTAQKRRIQLEKKYDN